VVAARDEEWIHSSRGGIGGTDVREEINGEVASGVIPEAGGVVVEDDTSVDAVEPDGTVTETQRVRGQGQLNVARAGVNIERFIGILVVEIDASDRAEDILGGRLRQVREIVGVDLVKGG